MSVPCGASLHFPAGSLRKAEAHLDSLVMCGKLLLELRKSHNTKESVSARRCLTSPEQFLRRLGQFAVQAQASNWGGRTMEDPGLVLDYEVKSLEKYTPGESPKGAVYRITIRIEDEDFKFDVLPECSLGTAEEDLLK